MDWGVELPMVGQVLLAFLLGALIGWEREWHGQPAGIRTYAAIAVGACVFGLVSVYSGHGHDTTRIAAQVVSGVGFLGAGVIFRRSLTNNGNEEGIVAGLTTAASLWAAAAIGLAVAYHMYIIACLTALIVFLMLLLPMLPWWSRISHKKVNRRGTD